MSRTTNILRKAGPLIVGVVTLGALYGLSRSQYLLFHSIIEIFSVAVGIGVFLIVWNARRFVDNNYLLLVGIAFLFVALVDLLHTLAYQGMGVFKGLDESNAATQLWIVARGVQALSLVAAPLFLRRRLNVYAALAVCLVVTAPPLVSIFYWKNFPACFVTGSGLTQFKIISEYAICVILLAALILLLVNRPHFDRGVLALLVLAIALTIPQELIFTEYRQVYDPLNALGHLVKLAATYLIYIALVRTSLTKPHDVLFRSLMQSQAALRRIEWLLTRGAKGKTTEEVRTEYQPRYGNLVELNQRRVIVDSVGENVLLDIVGEFLGLLDTSAAVYEKNGDYALGLMASGWCQYLDEASRKLCDTEDNVKALACGLWHCHESCWTAAGKKAVESGGPADVECLGGLRLHAVPILASGEVVGAISMGYGDPPKDPKTLRIIAERYRVPLERLHDLAEVYESRPPFIVDVAKTRLHTAARLIGTIAEREQVRKQLEDERAKLKAIIDSAPEGIIVADHEGRLVMTNPAAKRLFKDAVSYGASLSDPALPLVCRPDGRPYEPRERPLLRAALDGETQTNLQVAIIWPDGERRDVLESAAPIRDSDGRPAGAVAIFQDISAEHRFRAELQQRAGQLETLIREAHHRIRNNLQSVISLLELERSEVDAASVGSLDRCVSRIRAIALVHRLLTTEATSSVSLQNLLKGLAELAEATYGGRQGRQIDIGVSGSNFTVSSRTATSLAIVVNELITNAMLHAFPERRHGRINVVVSGADRQAEIRVTDNGRGCPEAVEQGTGLLLTRNIVEHDLGGEFRMSGAEQGCECVIRFPI